MGLDGSSRPARMRRYQPVRLLEKDDRVTVFLGRFRDESSSVKASDSEDVKLKEAHRCCS